MFSKKILLSHHGVQLFFNHRGKFFDILLENLELLVGLYFLVVEHLLFLLSSLDGVFHCFSRQFKLLVSIQ